MRHARHLSLAALLVLVAGVSSVSAQDNERTYGYVRILEGRATVTESRTGEEAEAEEQLPVLTGDVFYVHASSRLEAVLADRSRLRLDQSTVVELQSLAGSADSQATQTMVRLESGRLHYVVVDPPPADRAPVVETVNAQFFLQDSAQVLISIEGVDSTLLTVRRGYVEVVTSRGSSLVRAQEEALVSGSRWTNVAIGPAGRPDRFEDWADESEYRISQADAPLVEEELQYEAASLEDNGAWLTVEGSSAWRPHVSATWQPYWDGRWAYTPTGLSWVSNESWGWVPYHYGAWDYHHHHGWLWYPGGIFATAHVQWYWGSAHVGWVPKRYYHGHRRALFGIHIGDHGGRHHYAEANWRAYDRWVFCPSAELGHHRQHRSHHRSSYFRDRGNGQVPRGLIASDTAGLGRSEWRDPDKVQRVLERPVRRASQPVLGDSTRSARLDSTVRRLRSAPRASGTGIATRQVETRATRSVETPSRSPVRRAAAAEVLRRSRRVPTPPVSTRGSDGTKSDTARALAASRYPTRRAPVTRVETDSGVRSLPVERRSTGLAPSRRTPSATPRRSSAEPAQRVIESIRSTRRSPATATRQAPAGTRSVGRSPSPVSSQSTRRAPSQTTRPSGSVRPSSSASSRSSVKPSGSRVSPRSTGSPRSQAESSSQPASSSSSSRAQGRSGTSRRHD